jgi:hypothetical protein
MRVVAVVEATVDSHAFSIALKISLELDGLRECDGARKQAEQSGGSQDTRFDFHFIAPNREWHGPKPQNTPRFTASASVRGKTTLFP